MHAYIAAERPQGSRCHSPALKKHCPSIGVMTHVCVLYCAEIAVGGLGLNLSAADRVILLEPMWNAASEQQCIARARQGNLIVYKLVSSATVEDYAFRHQLGKLPVAGAAVDGRNSFFAAPHSDMTESGQFDSSLEDLALLLSEGLKNKTMSNTYEVMKELGFGDASEEAKFQSMLERHGQSTFRSLEALQILSVICLSKNHLNSVASYKATGATRRRTIRVGREIRCSKGGNDSEASDTSSLAGACASSFSSSSKHRGKSCSRVSTTATLSSATSSAKETVGARGENSAEDEHSKDGSFDSTTTLAMRIAKRRIARQRKETYMGRLSVLSPIRLKEIQRQYYKQTQALLSSSESESDIVMPSSAEEREPPSDDYRRGSNQGGALEETSENQGPGQ